MCPLRQHAFTKRTPLKIHWDIWANACMVVMRAGNFAVTRTRPPCVLKHLASILLALAIAIATIWIHPPTHERAMYGTEGAPHENWQAREVGGWPMPYLADNPGISVPHRPGIEDDFRPGAFVATFSFWLIVTSALAVIARRLAAARRGGR